LECVRMRAICASSVSARAFTSARADEYEADAA
jgi:hypothetical protein